MCGAIAAHDVGLRGVRSESRRRLACVFLSRGASGPAGFFAFRGALSFGPATRGGGEDFLDGDDPADGQAHEGVVVAAGAAAGFDGHQQGGDDSDVDLEGHALLGLAEKMLEAGHALEPAEEQFDLPAMLVDQGDDLGRQIGAVGQQFQRPIRLVGVGDADAAQGLVQGRAAVAPADADEFVAEHADFEVGGAERTGFEGLHACGVAQPRDEVAVGLEDVGQQFVLLESAVEDVEAGGLQGPPQLVGLAGFSVGEADVVGDAAEDVEVEVSADVAFTNGPVGVGLFCMLEQGPGDARGDGEEGAIDGQQLAGDLVESGIVGALADALFEAIDDGPEQVRIEESLGVGEGAFGDAWGAEVLADRGVFEGILDFSQAGDGGIEEGQEVGEDQMVVEEGAVGMVAVAAQAAQFVIEEPRVTQSADAFGRPACKLYFCP